MAIVEMKKVRLLALRRDRSRVFRAMQRLGCVHVADGGADVLRVEPIGAMSVLNAFRDEPRADGTTDRLLKACDLATALERLDRWWDDCFSPASSADAQLAGECSRS